MSVPYRTTSYGNFLSHVSALIGVDQADFQSTELTFLNTFFNRAFRKIWEMQLWTDLCPYGEVRFPLNLVTDPNLTQGSGTYATANGTTIAPLSFPNPLDNRTTAALVLETTPTAVHNVQYGFSGFQPSAFIPSQPYAVKGYAQPNGRNYLFVTVNDGGATYTCFFNLVPGAAIVGTIGGSGTPPQCAVQLSGNGYYVWSMAFTASTTAGVGSIQVGFSPDGATTSYAGNSAVGMYLWGTTCFLSQNILPASYYIPWTQLGETAIDSVFEVWATDPAGAFIPQRVSYRLNPNGIEIIGPSSLGGLYLYYRPQRPVFFGSVFNAALTYAAGNTMYYTSTAGVLNYYTCLIATSAGQTPDTTPASWAVIPIPYVLFEYCVYNAYADWLGTEGQTAKSAAMFAYAQSCVDDENDRQERQNGVIQPWKVATHLTSQSRGMGYQGQNFSPSGTFYVN